MSTNKWTAAADAEILKLINSGDDCFEAREILARKLGTSTHKLRARLHILKKRQIRDAVEPNTPKPSFRSVTTKGDKEAQVITGVSSTVRTLEDALIAGEVDTETWEVTNFVLNKWDSVAKVYQGDDGEALTAVELWQVKLWLKRKLPYYAQKAAESLLKRIEDKAPIHTPLPKVKRTAESLMLELSAFDSHFGKLCWSPETLSDYDCKIAESYFQAAVIELLSHAKPYNVSKILIPIGQDFFHFNDSSNTTVNGTPQDADTRFEKVFRTGVRAMERAIEECLKLAPVELIYVPGNHDRFASWHMAEQLKARFHNCSDVTVDSEPTSRKFRKHGIVLLGFTHGNEENHRDLPGIMMAEATDLLPGTKHREFHLGHFHKSKEIRYTAGDQFGGGCAVRCLPSLAGVDSWHYRKGYVGNGQAAVAFFWSDKRGYLGHFSAAANVK